MFALGPLVAHVCTPDEPPEISFAALVGDHMLLVWRTDEGRRYLFRTEPGSVASQAHLRVPEA